ncbi:MAG: tetratricopeptide repeat protein [Bacteroidia bacterium]
MELEHLIIGYTQQIRKSPRNAELYYNRGVIYTILQDNVAAIHDFNMALDLEPALADAYRNRATVYIKLKEYEKSLEDCNMCIKLFPQSADAYYNRATVYYQLKKYPAALKDWGKVIELQSGNGEAYFHRGNTYLALQNYNQALADFDIAARIKPDYADEWIQRGQAKMQLKDYEGALADFEKASEMGTKNYNSQLPFFIASAKVYAGKMEEALSELLRFVNLTPTAEANFQISLIYTSLQQPEQALIYAREATFLEKTNAQYWVQLGAIRVALKDFEEAMKDFNTALKLSPEYWQVHYELGKCKAARKQYKAATYNFDRAIQLNPTHLDSYFQSALANYELKAYPNVITDLHALLKMQPEHTEAIHLLIETRWELKQYAMSVDDLSNLIEKHPKEAQWYYYRAVSHQNLGKHASAIADFNAFEAFAHQTPSPDFYAERATCYLEIHKFEEAKKDFHLLQTKDIDKSKEFVKRQMNAIEVRFNLRKYEEVLGKCENLLKVIGNELAILLKQAQAYQRLQRQADALQIWQEIIKISPKQAAFYYERALIYELQGENELAKADFEQIQMLDASLAENYAREDYAAAKLKSKSKNYTSALQHLDRCLTIYPQYGLAYLLRGECFANLGEEENAITDYVHAYLLDATDSYKQAQLYASEANIKIGVQNFRAARLLLAYAIALNPNNSNLYYKKGLCHQELEEEENALKCFELAQEKGFYNEDIKERIAHLTTCFFQKEVEKQEETVAIPEILEVNDKETPLSPSEQLQQDKEREELVAKNERLSEAIARKPELIDLYLERGRNYAKLGEYDAALQDFEEAIQRCEGDARHIYKAITATFEAIKMVFYSK